jgi:hypothetical protein
MTQIIYQKLRKQNTRMAVSQLRQGGRLLEDNRAAKQMMPNKSAQRIKDAKKLHVSFEPVQQVKKEEEEPFQGKYASETPVRVEQQATAKPIHTALSDNLKSGIDSLSSVSLNNVKVHYKFPLPAQLNPLASAQDSDIHVAPGQDIQLPHESWHLAQQTRGCAKPAMPIQEGVPVNDDKKLEHEADVMGARALADYTVQRKAENTLTASKRTNGHPSHKTAQRQVRNVNWNTATLPVPAQQILDNHPHFTDINCTLPQLRNAVTPRFRWTGTADMPTKVAATTKLGRPNGAGNGTSHTAKVGQIGRDEYFIKRGVDQSEAFEGGHLISAALWDANDGDVASMNRSENLVPMSRGLNIYTYADQIEAAMSGGLWRRWTITPTRHNYQIPEKHLAYLLGNLPLHPGHNGDHLLTLQSWISDNVHAIQGGVVRVANENPLLGPYEQADDGPTLITLLQQTGAWRFLTEALRAQVALL